MFYLISGGEFFVGFLVAINEMVPFCSHTSDSAATSFMVKQAQGILVGWAVRHMRERQEMFRSVFSFFLKWLQQKNDEIFDLEPHLFLLHLLGW